MHLGLLFEISALSEGFSLSEFEFKIKWFWVLQGNNRLEWSLSNRHSRSTVRSILAAWDWTWTLTPQRPPQSNLWNQSTRTKMKALCMICDCIIANYESVMLEILFFFEMKIFEIWRKNRLIADSFHQRKASKKLPNQDNVLLDFLEEKENIWHFSMNNEINIKAEFSLSEIKRIP